jgi:hypothetical protein
MRALIVIVGAALSLAACGGGSQSNTVNADQGLSADSMTTNDVTAIDAVTGEAANMAADVDVNFTTEQQLDNGSNTAAHAATGPARPSSPRPASPGPKTVTAPASQPVSNTTANAVQ